ncbi:hypothetical protein HQ531_11705 [bacterium]|nr:hypothetical protein [bacterium]
MNVRLVIILVLFPVILQAKISDPQISATVEKYFAWSRGEPTLISADIVQDYIYGRTLKIIIIANRNTKEQDLGFAFATAATVANIAATPFDMLWVEMDIHFKNSETTIAIAPAECSIDAMILKNCDFDDWWNGCLQFP